MHGPLLCAEFVRAAKVSKFAAGESLQEFMTDIMERFAKGLRGASLPRVDSSLPPPATGATPAQLAGTWDSQSNLVHVTASGEVESSATTTVAAEVQVAGGAEGGDVVTDLDVVPPPPDMGGAALARQSSRAD